MMRELSHRGLLGAPEKMVNISYAFGESGDKGRGMKGVIIGMVGLVPMIETLFIAAFKARTEKTGKSMTPFTTSGLLLAVGFTAWWRC